MTNTEPPQNTTPTESSPFPEATPRIRESVLQATAQAALTGTVEMLELTDSPVAERARETVDRALILIHDARAVFESGFTAKRKADPDERQGYQQIRKNLNELRYSEDDIFKVLPFYLADAQVDDEVAKPPYGLADMIYDGESIALDEKLDTDDPGDTAYDSLLRAILDGLEDTQLVVSEHYKRYQLTIGMNHPRKDLQVFITRRETTIEEEMRLGCEVDHPHGVYYSIAFTAVPREAVSDS